MADDEKITELGAETAPAVTDLVVMVDDVGGTPVTDKITLANLLKVVDALTELTVAPALTDTFLVIDGGTPKKIQRKKIMIRYAEVMCFSFRDEEATEVGNGAGYLHIPADLAGLDLVEAHGEVRNAGAVGGLLTIQLHNETQAADMLSTEITIDVAETGSDTAATPAVIDSAEDDVAVNDLIRIDIDTIHDTAAEGLIVTLGFG